MADSKLSALTALAGADAATGDLVEVVDVSDTSLAASGTNKKITLGGIATAVTALGSLATDTEVATAVSNHAAATDPHGDRAFATSAVGTHEADTTSVHGIADTSALETTSGAQSKVDTHVNDTTAAHAASAISFTPAGTIAGTDVQTAVAEVATDAASALSSHESDTTSVHGIADTSALLTAVDVPGDITATGTPSSSTFLRGDGTWATPAGGGGGDLLAANNLSDLADAATARSNLGLAIGTNVQAYSSVLAATTASFLTADETKLDGIEALADVTDATNVAAAGAVMKSTVDAKGDLLAGTADNTVARLAVGATNGHVLKVASGETTGLQWAGQSEVIVIAVGDETTAITTGTAKVTFRMPFAMTLSAVRASLAVASSSGTPTIDINEGDTPTSILSTKLTIDASELTSTTAATAAVISDTALADDAAITIDIDTAGTGAKGLKVALLGTRA